MACPVDGPVGWLLKLGVVCVVVKGLNLPAQWDVCVVVKWLGHQHNWGCVPLPYLTAISLPLTYR